MHKKITRHTCSQKMHILSWTRFMHKHKKMQKLEDKTSLPLVQKRSQLIRARFELFRTKIFFYFSKKKKKKVWAIASIKHLQRTCRWNALYGCNKGSMILPYIALIHEKKSRQNHLVIMRKLLSVPVNFTRMIQFETRTHAHTHTYIYNAK